MNYVIVNEHGELYGGCLDGEFCWYRSKRRACVMDKELCDKVYKQFEYMGIKVAVRSEREIARKWVQKSLDATR